MGKRVLRPMSLTQLFDEAFDLYKQNFLLFVGTFAIAYLPYVLLWKWLVWAKPAHSTLIFSLATWTEYALWNAALVRIISDTYLGLNPTPLQAYKAVIPKLPRLFLASMLMMVLVRLGMFLIVPGLILMAWSLFVTPIITLEHKGVVAAIRRSAQLCSKSYLRVFAVIAIATSLLIIAVLVVQMPLVKAVTGQDLHGNPMSSVLGAVFFSITMMLLLPPLLTVITLLYYDARMRREGFDVEMLARDLSRIPDDAPVTGVGA